MLLWAEQPLTLVRMSVTFCCMDRLIPRSMLDALVTPVEHNLLGWMLVGGVAEVSLRMRSFPLVLPS